MCSISNAPWHSNFCKGFTKKSKAKEEESYCKARVSRSENEIASYWYHNVLLGMPLNLVMGSEATTQTAKSGDFEVVDSAESATFEYIMYIKDQKNQQLDSGIGHRSVIIKKDIIK